MANYKVTRKNELAHNYDPEYNKRYYEEHKQEAHDYYEAHKQLKGRSTSGLNEEGKMAAQYLKDNLNARRKEKVALSKEDMQRQTESKKNEMLNTIESHKTTMQSSIDRINNKLKKMSPKEKRIRGQSLKDEINRLREDNASKRAELQEAFKKDRVDLSDKHKSNVESYKSEYENDYANALDELLKDSKYQKQKKSKSTSSNNSVSTPASRSLKEIKKIYKK